MRRHRGRRLLAGLAQPGRGVNDDDEWDRFIRQVRRVNLAISVLTFVALLAGLWALDHWS